MANEQTDFSISLATLSLNIVAHPGALASSRLYVLASTRCCRYPVSEGNNEIQKQWPLFFRDPCNSSVLRRTSAFPRQPLWSAAGYCWIHVALCKPRRGKWSTIRMQTRVRSFMFSFLLDFGGSFVLMSRLDFFGFFFIVCNELEMRRKHGFLATIEISVIIDNHRRRSNHWYWDLSRY